MNILSKSLDDTANLASNLVTKIGQAKKDDRRALVICLYGDLGSGKTTFVQFLAKALEIKEIITSPTFVIQKNCQIPKSFPYKKLVHIDCYRINDPAEMTVLRWDETLADPHNLIVIEWPERIKSLLPKNCMDIKFKFVDETTREIDI